ncbi:helix-turn-helix domain-containing protein [Nocardia tengchongensis]|uniref:helix-turn-helix domain-containing protein n=1 Tax=Nocardia tengchongensis TaxID=2055889 RepID=UPI00368F9836
MRPTPGRNLDQQLPVSHQGEPADLQMPSLGRWLQRVREDRNFTREEAADRTHISKDYINKIDRGYVPGREMVLRLITGYDMSPMQARHTLELWQPPATLASVSELRERIDTPSRRRTLEQLDRTGVICVYTDPLWNVLSANKSFHRALPGLDQANSNVATWFFSRSNNTRRATNVTLQWEQEALFHVAMLRGALGHYRASHRAVTLFDQLKRDRDFRRIWTSSIRVAYARQPNELAHLRDPETGDPYSISIDIAEVSDTRDIRVCYAYRESHADPL